MKRGNKRVERYRKNSVHPEKDTKHKKEEKKYEKVNAKFMDKFGSLAGLVATEKETIRKIVDDLNGRPLNVLITLRNLVSGSFNILLHM